MKEKQRVASPAPRQPWTKPEDYIGALARKRSFRRARRERIRSEPERPRLLLSTLPFFTLMGLLAILAVAIMIVAFPGAQPLPKAGPVVQKEQGLAQRGWFEEAKKDMH